MICGSKRIDRPFRESVRPGSSRTRPGKDLEPICCWREWRPSISPRAWEPGKQPKELPQFFQASTYKDGRPGGWDPAERIKDMDLDGVEADVIYTTLGFRQFWFTDAVLQRACFRVYNDWLAEYCAYAPTRLAGLALIPPSTTSMRE